MPELDLESALEQFDRTLKNVELLQIVWDRYAVLIPDHPALGLDSPEADSIRREFAHISAGLPTIDGYRPERELMPLDTITHTMLEYFDIGEPLAEHRVVEAALDQGRTIDEYRFRLKAKRRSLVRTHLDRVVSEIDAILASAASIDGGLGFANGGTGWDFLKGNIGQLERLLGEEMLPKSRDSRYGDLRRHLYFGQPNDLYDIVNLDWPSVRSAVLDIVFEGEPIPISVDDLGDLVRSQPTGTVTSKLSWSDLKPDEFERLLFDLLRLTPSYENVEWQMKTNAPDRGRDISADRVSQDDLSGVRRSHVLIQCKHWLSKSVNLTDTTALLAEAELWTKKFTVVVIATSGRFTQDAIEWRERRDMAGTIPLVEFWPESHLEHILASRPALRASYFQS